MKKEALVAGLGSFLSNQTKDPDRTALNLAKAIGTEVGGAAGGVLGSLPVIVHPVGLLTGLLGYAGGGYLAHKALNAATKKEPSILDKIKGLI